MNCKICASPHTKRIFEAFNIHGRHILDREDRFEIMRCQECEAVFVADLHPDAAFYEKYYPKDYYEEGSLNGFISGILDKAGITAVRNKERVILNLLSPSAGEKRKVLDIGCGEGYFLEHLNNNFFEKYGIEINPHGSLACRKRNIEVYDRELKDLRLEDDFFDVVTLWHVVEHLDDPLDTLLEVKRVLKKGGVLALSTPNTDSLGFRVGENFWFHLDSPRHLVLYNDKSINTLLKKAGFEVLAMQNTFYDYPLDLFWSLRRSYLKYIVYPLYPFFKFFDHETKCYFCRNR